MPRGPEPNAWIRTPEGDWRPLGRVTDLQVNLKIDFGPATAAMRKVGEAFSDMTRSFEAFAAGIIRTEWTLSPKQAEQIWAVFSGQPYFGPRQYRQGVWVALVIVLLGMLAILLV